MGKRLITQRRGKGTPRYRVPSHRFAGEIRYPSGLDYKNGLAGQVVDIYDDPARTAPVAKVMLDETFEEIRIIAAEGMRIGQWVNIGVSDKPKIGDVLPVGMIPEGTDIYNIELSPGDGGKFARSSGSSGYLVSHEREQGVTYVKLPSKKVIALNDNSKATIGVVAGSGRVDKPMVIAGQAHHKHKARNKLYPTVRGVAMNAVDHPHGGGSHGYTGRPATVARNTPPGRKVGHIAAKRTGRRKR